MIMARKDLSGLSADDIEQIMCFLDDNCGTVFHEPHFNRVVENIFHTAFFYDLAYNRERKLMALCPLHLIKKGLLSHIFSNPAIHGVPYGGWVYNKDETSVQELMEQIKLSHNEALTYWSIPQINNDGYVDIKNKREFKTGIIDLTLSLDDILHQQISKKRRQAINRSIRRGVVIERLDPDKLHIFIEQCNILRDSVGLDAQSSDYFTRLFECYYTAKKIAAFAARLDNAYIASGVIIGNKNMMHLWVAGRPKHVPQHVRRTELLLWETIKYAKEYGSRYFDLCVIEPERLSTIAHFKLEFSKHIVPFYYITRRNMSYRIISKAQNILRMR